ncbi:Basic-leucine zipper transcription factor [Parasponia andersonii]|uniref:Basic-leucine zipper transcription factor n=1 Tax=Parasponia andersonii TaxID=3476 RepID=A0A2P5CGU0_PARAD|nr:Basic-leucine zipper transcription factor [Parasponia andersonii]
MASSKVVIASASTANAELPRQSSICSISTIINDEASRTLASVTMDDLLNLKSFYPEQPQPQTQQEPQAEAPFPAPGVDDVWNSIVAGRADRRAESGENGGVMTLEDYLRDEDVRVPVGYGQFQMPSQGVEGPVVVYGNGSGGSGRGKRKVVEAPLDKATEQKQRRMIKNRESAARSRERKQAYTVELESLVTQLEEENARLLREEAEEKKQRLNQSWNAPQVVELADPSSLRSTFFPRFLSCLAPRMEASANSLLLILIPNAALPKPH